LFWAAVSDFDGEAQRIRRDDVLFTVDRVVHNHPSGEARPSRADEHLTQTIKQATALVDVRVLDHFIVAGEVVCSMAEIGLV
jgi:hypothetical protein